MSATALHIAAPLRRRRASAAFQLLAVVGLLAAIAAVPARAQAPQALQFDGVNDYVTFGAAPSLGVSTFTIELRFKRTGAGVTVSTGTGGVTAVPLITKGRGEGDGSTVDMNYFLGIRGTDNVLVADFEEGTGQTSPGLNHPVAGVTPIVNGVWYHAAATFDGTTWALYLDGNLEATLLVGAARLPQSASIQHAGLATAMTSAGLAAGFFAGVIDEPRVWNVARTQAEIQGAMGAEVLAAPGLIARWSLNEGAGTGAGNSIAGSVNGTLTNGPAWTTDSTLPLASEAGLRFDGTNAYVTFGDPTALHLAEFTVETWFRRDGPGVTTSTGTGGITNAIPLIARGRGEAENPAVDLNYLLGIRASDNVLVADFEEGASGPSPSLNHPVAGVTPIVNGTWYHAAAAYDGATWRLYLDGALEAQLAVGRPPAAAGTQHASLASALSSTGVPEGYFRGALDEVRIWRVARTQAEIQSTMNSALGGPDSGLVARWGLDEDAQTTVHSSAGATMDGVVTGAGWGWAAGSPFDATIPTPPADPGALAALAVGAFQVDLGWSDNSSDETGFEIERSVTGSGGPYSPLATVAANTVAYSDGGLSPGTEYCYRVRAVNGGGASRYAGPACATTEAVPNMALDFAGSDAYASFGDPATLHLSALTIELWLRRDGSGVGTDTGTNGIPDAIPLVAKGRAEAEDPARDINYLFGIKASSGVLCADFEEAAGGAQPSGNHPVLGVTPIGTGVWHHVAVTYDTTTWKLYLDGALDAQLAVGRPPASASTVALSLASALNSTGAASGFFDGAVDEVRIWNVARSEAEILSTINTQLVTPASGLVARWALDEGSGTTIASSAGTSVSGTVSGTGFAWTAGAPFNITPPEPPADPTGLAASAVSASAIHLAWSDNATNETGYEVERSTTGSGGPFSLLAMLGPDATSHDDTGLAGSTQYCYRVRARHGAAASGYAGPECATTAEGIGSALDFAGATYVTFGDPPTLDLAQFTVECWFRRDGAGTTVSTGNGGVPNAIPLVTKGTSEADASNVDMNFFLGIDDATDRLMADFEEGSGGSSPGLNHPVIGATTIVNGTWHHAAVTYDGTAWHLYLDGNLEATLAVGQPCQSQSIQPAALASSIRSNGTTAQGFFDGALDEVRIWNVARTQAAIQGAANARITTPDTGLVARWGLDEGSGTAVNGSAGTAANGTIVGSNYAWISPGAPFDLSFNLPPAAPALNGPAHQATGVGLAPSLDVGVSDPDGGTLTVTYYGRALAGGAPGPDFTLIGQPDTQYYTGELNGGTNAILQSINSWIVANRVPRNIAYVATLGDCVEHGDNGGDDLEWQRADLSYDLLENPGTTGLADGIPYGVTVGNHDQSPNGDPSGTIFYNQFFGAARFQGRPYYGGHYGTDNDNWYDLFSAGGMDFIVISLEYDTTPDQAVLDWADALLTTHAGRRAIVLSHNLCGTGDPATFSAQGSATYDALRGHPNLFLMLAGHVPGEGRRQDAFNGDTVHTLMSDYQGRTNGGNGWIRIMTFSPAANTIEVETYSPWLDQFETDADSRFTIAYNMSDTPAFQPLGSNGGVPSGSSSQLPWPGLLENTTYEWYATVSDGQVTTTGPIWRFTTTPDGTPPTVTLTSPNGGQSLSTGENADLTWTAADNVGVASVDLLLSRDGASGSYESLASGIANSGSFTWTVTGPATSDAFVRVVAHDALGNQAADTSDAAFTIVGVPTGVGDELPREFALEAVAPNPTAGEARLVFAMPRPAAVRLTVHDVQGREVARLVDGERPAGRHPVAWDGRVRGGPARAGLYFVRLLTPEREFVRRLVMVR